MFRVSKKGKWKIGWLMVCLSVENWLANSSSKSLKTFSVLPLLAASKKILFENVSLIMVF